MDARPRLTVIGVGRLGLCFALCAERGGYDVLGVEVRAAAVRDINERTLSSREPRVEAMLREATALRATDSLASGVEHSDLLFVFVDTPESGDRHCYDHSNVNRVLRELAALNIRNKHIIIGCTVLPGYLGGVAKLLVRDLPGCTLNYNPEFIAQGDIIGGLQRPDMVLIGEENAAAGDAIAAVYARLCENTPHVCRMSVASAEVCKLSVNCFITTKITFANMVGDIADRTPNADKDAILAAVGCDSRIGSRYLRAGYGFGGPCFPRDNRALGQYARSVGIEPLLPVATDEYNKVHARLMAERLLEQRPDQDEFVFRNVTFKHPCPVPITQESQKLAVAALVARAGRRVVIRDTRAVCMSAMEEYGSLFVYEPTD